MSAYLLDTNALSECLRRQPSARFLERMVAARRNGLATSTICVMELRFGAARHPKGDALWSRIENELLGDLETLPVDEAVAIRAGELMADLERKGTPIGVEDVLIGATALANGLTVVTRNTRHLARLRGLEVEWWGD